LLVVRTARGARRAVPPAGRPRAARGAGEPAVRGRRTPRGRHRDDPSQPGLLAHARPARPAEPHPRRRARADAHAPPRRPADGAPPAQRRRRASRARGGVGMTGTPPQDAYRGLVLGTDREASTPLGFSVFVDEHSYLQLDDVVHVRTGLPGNGETVDVYGVVDEVTARQEG